MADGLDPATAEHVISQIERLLDAEVREQNRMGLHLGARRKLIQAADGQGLGPEKSGVGSEWSSPPEYLISPEAPMSIIDKAKRLAERTAEFNAAIDKDLDELAAHYDDAERQKNTAVGAHKGYVTQVKGALEDAEKAITILSNSAPLESGS